MATLKVVILLTGMYSNLLPGRVFDLVELSFNLLTALMAVTGIPELALATKISEVLGIFMPHQRSV